MKNKISNVIKKALPFIIALILVYLTIVIGSLIIKNKIQQSLDHNQVVKDIIQEEPLLYDLSNSIPEAFNDDIKRINICGNYIDRIEDLLKCEDYEKLYSLLNSDVLETHYYECDYDSFIKSFKSFNQLFNNNYRIILVGTEMSSLHNGLIVSLCFVGEIEDDSMEVVYDFKNARWVDFTFYINNFSAFSFLPCPEVLLDSYSQQYGFQKISH